MLTSTGNYICLLALRTV